MGDALAAGEEKAWALFGVVLAHPALQIDMADGEIERVDQFGVVRRDAVPPEGQLPIEDTVIDAFGVQPQFAPRSEEHTSELQSLMRISYAVFCLKKKT